MAVQRMALMRDDWTISQGLEGISPIGAYYFVCDLDAELPADAKEGSLAYSRESETQHVRLRNRWELRRLSA